MDQPIFSVTIIIYSIQSTNPLCYSHYFLQSINQPILSGAFIIFTSQSINQPIHSVTVPSLFLQRINKSILSPSLFPLPNKPSILLPSLFPPPNQSINQSTNTFLIFHQPINQFIMLSVSSSLNCQTVQGGGIIVFLLKIMSYLKQLFTTSMITDSKSQFKLFCCIYDDGDKESIQIVLLHL